MEIVIAVITSVIAGAFSLVGIWLNHNLSVQRKNPVKETKNSTEQSIPIATPTITIKSDSKRTKKPHPEHITPTKKRLVPMLLWLSILPYTGFTLILLTESNGDDQQAGFFFMINSLIIMSGSVITYLDKTRASTICIAAAIIQILILAAMISLGIGDADIIVSINLGIAVAFGLMALFYRKKRESMT